MNPRLKSVDAIKALAAQLERCPDVTRLNSADEPESWALAYTLSELESSFLAFVERGLPELLDASDDPQAISDALHAIGEILRHIDYHIKDGTFFSYIRSE